VATSLLVSLFVLMLAPPVLPKTMIDFDANLDYSKFKTSAYLGGVEQLYRLLWAGSSFAGYTGILLKRLARLQCWLQGEHKSVSTEQHR